MKKSKTPALLIDAYEKHKNITPLELATITGYSVQTAKNFLRKNDIKQQPLETNNNKKFYSPAGSDKPGAFQSDIMYMNDYKKQNKQHMAIITLLEITTRVAYARGLKSTSSKHVIPALESILGQLKKEGRPIHYVLTDDGPEYSNEFVALMKQHKIETEKTEPYLSSKLNRTNRLHRTIRQHIAETYARNKNNHWIEHLPQIMEEIRHTPSFAFRETLKKDNGKYSPIRPIDITEKQKKIINEHEKRQAIDAMQINFQY